MEKYNFKEIENKWQEVWAEKRSGIAEDFSARPKHYHLVEFPYPSGAGLHVGHCMGYGASDAFCRMKRMQGYNVMFPIGWDAFGLPTENYALRTGIHPSKATADNIAIFKKQIRSLGYSFDWSREVNTTDPDYYRWTQWIFLQFYKHSYSGRQSPSLVKVADNDTTTPRLAYKKEMPINWCPSCKIGLANEEVVAGACERCGTPTKKRMQSQWLLRITAYADRLIDDLFRVDYEEKIKTQQINWIGRSEGATIKFELRSLKLDFGDKKDNPAPKIKDQKPKIFLEVFTTRADTLFGATYLVLAPEHPLIEKLRKSITNYEEVIRYIEQAKKKSDLERTELQKDKSGVELKGITAINPINSQEIAVWLADYVLANYGHGAIMAVPAHDKRDFDFAKKYNLPIRTVIKRLENKSLENDCLFTEYGYLISSDSFNGLSSEEAQIAITKKLKERGAGDFALNYKLRDWIFSRQHYWGEPIPIIYCQECGTVPVPENDLPLELPMVKKYEPTNTGESPLALISKWVNTKCPGCGGPAKRETDTMPNWAGSSWYFLRYCDPSGKEQFATNDKLNYWLPVDIYNGGMEHTTLHLLYSRFWYKFLYDLGVAPGSEPYTKRIAHGIILGPDGQKMSKSRGNVIGPDEMVEKYGADTLRAYIMFIGPYNQESAWNTAGVQGVYRFLNRLWNNQKLVCNQKDDKDLLVKLNQTIAGVTADLENFHLNTVVSQLMEFNNLLERVGHISHNLYEKFIQIMFPIMPHLSEELWQRSGHRNLLEETEWPKPEPRYLVAERIEVVIQINGKVRHKITVDSVLSDESLKEEVLGSLKVKESLENQQILKVIIVPKKLVNIVTMPR